MVGRVLTILFLLLVVADVYIYFLFIRKLTQSALLHILWFVPSLLLIGLYYLYIAKGGSEHRYLFSIICLAVAVPEILFFVVSLLDLPLRYFFDWKVYPFTVVGLLVAACTVFIVIYGSTIGKTKFEVNEVEFRSSKIPESFDGYKVVQISDIHIGNWKGDKNSIERMVTLVNKQKPDVVVITGDLVHNSAAELDGFEDILSEIKAPDGVYSILGNHDYGSYKRWENKRAEVLNFKDLQKRQADMGWKLLNNEHTYLTKGNDRIALIGVENDGAPPFSKHGDLPKAMKGTKDSEFKLLLSHDPTHWRREVLNTDVDLMLAGHTHGTQFAIGRFSFASLMYPEWGGMYTEGSQGLYVNVGIGAVMLPFRFGAWPEITVITLKKE